MPRGWGVTLAYPVAFASEEADAEAAREKLATESGAAGNGSASYSVRDSGECYRVMETVRVASYRGLTAQVKAHRKMAELKAQQASGSMAEFSVVEVTI